MSCMAASITSFDRGQFQHLYAQQIAEREQRLDEQTDPEFMRVAPQGLHSKETTPLTKSEFLEDLFSSKLSEEEFVGKAVNVITEIDVLNTLGLNFPLDQSEYMRMLADENIDRTAPGFDSECRRVFEIMVRDLLKTDELSPERALTILTDGTSQEDVQFVKSAATLLICLCAAKNDGVEFVTKLFGVDSQNILDISAEYLCDANNYTELHNFAQIPAWRPFSHTAKV